MFQHYWDCTCRLAAYTKKRAFEKTSMGAYIAAATTAATVAAPWSYVVFALSVFVVFMPGPE